MALTDSGKKHSAGGNLVVVCALKKETSALRESLGDRVRLITTGLGSDRTLDSLNEFLRASEPSLVIFTGMAGQLDPSLETGDFVFPESWRLESGKEFESPAQLCGRLRKAGWNIEGTGLTVPTPVVRKKDRIRLFQETGARICDMESAAAMMVCSSHGVDCLAPKIVSDTAGSGMLAFYRRFDRHIELLAGHLTRLLDDLVSIDS